MTPLPSRNKSTNRPSGKRDLIKGTRKQLLGVFSRKYDFPDLRVYFRNRSRTCDRIASLASAAVRRSELARQFRYVQTCRGSSQYATELASESKLPNHVVPLRCVPIKNEYSIDGSAGRVFDFNFNTPRSYGSLSRNHWPSRLGFGEFERM